ncbi:uracil-DNA glycosylase [Hamadaea sp. NPDC050747]|uniref:uracil-DNA glycosylase n=1 Tax=Hamadaea sp. NPDC050747 TaxID=3155789 RepID=UPI0033E187E0
MTAADLAALDEEVTYCRACPRLVEWREKVAREKRAAFRDQTYWGRPVPGFGPSDARILVLGLAPAAHGANRTGRMFTGDRSGEVLYAALYRAGLATKPVSLSADDDLRLIGTRITAPVKCAPPANKPEISERDNCAHWLHREIRDLPDLRVVVTLGAFGWAAWWQAQEPVYGVRPPSPRPRFGHGAVHRTPGQPVVLGCYHVSQQNTFTGRLTPAMLDDVFRHARSLAGEESRG